MVDDYAKRLSETLMNSANAEAMNTRNAATGSYRQDRRVNAAQ